MTYSETYQKIEGLIATSSRVLLVSGLKCPMDTLPTALALARLLEEAGKSAVLFYPWEIPPSLHFLHFEGFHTPKLLIASDYILTIDTRTHPVEKIGYQKDEDFLRIVITPTTPWAKEGSPAVSRAPHPFDLIITIGVQKLEDIHIYTPENVPFFRETPIINIDVDQSNTKYGTLCLGEEEALSCAEHATRLAKIIWEEHLASDTATALLTGIIAQTNNFQHPKINPQALFSAAYLIAKRANRLAIIRSLYKTKPLELIRLWGKLVSRLQYNEEAGIGWSVLGRQDFEETNSSPAYIPRLIEEVKNNFSQAKYLVLAWEAPSLSQGSSSNRICGLIYAAHEKLLEPLLGRVEGTREENTLFVNLEADTVGIGADALVHVVRSAIEQGRG